VPQKVLKIEKRPVITGEDRPVRYRSTGPVPSLAQILR
jgi:hypothetical protein